ncbi:MAG: ATP-binding protein [Desulfuromonadales bacterium]|nr:ATP-binding protein [Desulfuromonadales bacterium]
MRLQLKIILALGVLLTLVATASILYVKLYFSDQLRGELEKRGVSIARHLAQYSTTNLLARDRLALKMMAVTQAQSEADIVYIFFVDARGSTVLAHTFGESFPESLLAANPLPVGQEYSIRYLEAEEGALYDIAMQVEMGGLGQVRVGLSAAPISAAVNQLSGGILLVIVLFGGVALLFSLPLSASITRPVKNLMISAEAVAKGDFERQVSIASGDELGQLGESFNRMVDRLKASHHELRERNSELAEEVSRRRDAESKLAEQLSLLSILLDEIPLPVFFKDTGGLYRGCNRAFETFVGITRNELCGQTAATLLPPEEAAVHTQADNKLFDHPGSCRYEYLFTNLQGLRREVIFQKATYNLPSGELAGMVGIMVDVTGEREVDRMRNDFVSTMAHEFQTPLTAILGFCELLLGSEDLPVDQRNYINIINERAEHLSRLVDRSLDVNRIDSGSPIPLDLHLCYPDQLLRQILQSYMGKGSGYRFELHLPSQPPAILADEVRLTQVIENLLSNAIKYSPQRTLIRMDGSVQDGYFVVTVTDQGPGLTDQQRAQIFDKFYRVDSSNRAPSGTGLGLYISRAIVDAHGGTLEVENAPEGGSSFIVSIPLAPVDN